MSQKTVYSTLSQFCEQDSSPRDLLLKAGFHLIENKTGKRIKKEAMAEALKNADAVLAAVEPYDADLLAKLTKLKVISRCGAGADAIDLAAAKNLGIEVLVTRDEIVEPVAQMTLAMIFALARNVGLHQKDFTEGLWTKHTGALLSEWKIGLVGFGQIGKKVAEYLKPFGPKILVADPFAVKENLPPNISLCDLNTLLSEANLVSLHLARSSKEGYLMTAKEFALMKQGSYFVNTARGFLVEEKALEEALKKKHLAGAAMDVFEEEPYRGSLSKMSNVILTPHVATLTHASRAAMELKCAQNVVDFFERIKTA